MRSHKTLKLGLKIIPSIKKPEMLCGISGVFYKEGVK